MLRPWPFSYWICCFCRFQSAPDFLRSWAFTATCLASACDFSSAVCQLLTSNRLSLRLWTELLTSLLRTFSGFLTDLEMYVESTWKSVTNQFFCTFNRFIWYTVNFSVHTWNTEDSEGESLKKPGTFLLYLDSVLALYRVAANIPKNFLVGVN